jgi:hypothetical protein
MRIVGSFVAALALVGVGGALAKSTGAESPRVWFINPDYVGKGRFDRTMKVQFKVYERRGREHVLFQARDVSFLCNERTEHERRDLTTAQMPIHPDGQEFGRLFWGSSHGEVIYLVRGRLSRDRGKARGFVRAAVVPPQAEQDAGLPDCTTSGPRHWVARRVKSP